MVRIGAIQAFEKKPIPQTIHYYTELVMPCGILTQPERAVTNLAEDGGSRWTKPMNSSTLTMDRQN